MSVYRFGALVALYLAFVEGAAVAIMRLMTEEHLSYDGAQVLLLLSIALGVLAMGERREPGATA